jgi:hypothetical protein
MGNWLKDLLAKLVKAAAEWVDRCIPIYEPNAWNDGNGIEKNNNCYNYACDIQNNTLAQPGRAHGIILNWRECSCDTVTAAALADGLTPINCDAGCGCDECRHQVALVVDPGWDYHWYRKDRDGNWSHKIADTPATNLDNSGNIITDPRTADRRAPRAEYSEFCGCFCVNKSEVTIEGMLHPR